MTKGSRTLKKKKDKDNLIIDKGSFIMTTKKIPGYLGSSPYQPKSFITYIKNIFKKLKKI